MNLMGVALSALAVTLALGGSWRQKVLAATPIIWLKLSEATGQTSARDSSGNGYHGTYNGSPVLEQETTNPEGGSLALFDGTNDYVDCGDVAALEFVITAYTIAFRFKKASAPGADQRLFHKYANGATTGWVVAVSTNGTVYLIHRNAAGTGDAFSIATAASVCDGVERFIAFTWDFTTGANGVKSYVNGVLSSQATASTTSVSAATATAVRIGASDVPGEYLAAYVGEVMAFSTVLSAATLLDLYEAGVWTDVSDDLSASEELVFGHGISGNWPTDRLADPGSALFTLRNDAGNYGGVQGYYSPGHAAARSGFTHGILVRITLTYSGTAYVRWTGKIQDIFPEPGQFKSQRTHVTCVDLMGDLIEADLRTVTLQTSQTEAVLLRTLTESIAVTAQPLALRLDTGLDTIPYAFDDLAGEVKAIRPAGDLAISSMGFLSTTRYGYLRYENRNARQTSSSAHTLNNTMKDLIVPTSLDGVFNRIRLTFPPKRIDAAATTVLFSIPTASATNPSTLEIPALGTIEVSGDYFDPSDPERSIGGTAQVTPVATTDYLGNSSADGSGADQTADLTVVAVASAASATFTITSADAATVWVTKLQIRGKGLYADPEVTVPAESDQPYGERTITIAMPYQTNLTTIRDLAAYVLDQHENPSGRADGLVFDPQRTDALMLAALTSDLGTRITVTETVTGLSSDFFVHRMDFRIMAGRYMEVTLGLSASAFASDFWIMEDADSELGVNTYLGYG